ncbi:MAG: hypothetical protein RL180_1209, partial [Pseudomonadota bacterium]
MLAFLCVVIEGAKVTAALTNSAAF